MHSVQGAMLVEKGPAVLVATRMAAMGPSEVRHEYWDVLAASAHALNRGAKPVEQGPEVWQYESRDDPALCRR